MAITAFSFAAKTCPQDSRVRFGMVQEYKAMNKLKEALHVGVREASHA